MGVSDEHRLDFRTLSFLIWRGGLGHVGGGKKVKSSKLGVRVSERERCRDEGNMVFVGQFGLSSKHYRGMSKSWGTLRYRDPGSEGD